MKHKDAFARYQLIDRRLRNNMRPCPTFEELVDFIQNEMDQDISNSTVQKDIHNMRFNEQLGYFAPIVYDNYSKGYRYTDLEFTICIQELLAKIEQLK